MQGNSWTNFGNGTCLHISEEGKNDLTTRKPVFPEPELFKIFNLIPQTTDLEVLGGSRRSK